MEDIINVATQPQTFYYQNNQSQFYNMARNSHRKDVLNKMQQTFDTYNSTSIEVEKNNENISEEKKFESQEKHEHNNNNQGVFNNLNLKNIADLLGGNADFSKILLNALSGQNKDLANILKIINNPLVKQSLSKKSNKTISTENTSIDKQFSNNEFDKLEKVTDN